MYDMKELNHDLKTSGSFFGNLGVKAAFAAATDAALFVREELVKESKFNVHALLDIQHLISCYFDPVLVDGILRTLDRKEVAVVGYKDQISGELLRIPVETSYPGLIAGYAWAAINQKLPKKPVLHLLNRIAETEDSKLLKLLLENP